MNKLLSRIVWLVIATPAIYLLIVWNKIPDNIALHFDWQGEADRYGSKNELLIITAILVGMSVLMYLLLTNIYRIDPKKNAAENKDRLRRLAFGVVTFICAVLVMIIYNSVHSNIYLSMNIILAGMGLFFAFIGNYMHNIKPNYFAGFRLPWTLENEDNWKKTHALAGKLWFAGGLFLMIVCLFLPSKAALTFFFSFMVIITLIPVIYSFRLFQKRKRSSDAQK